MQQSNTVLFVLEVDKNGETQYMSARIKLPSGREFHVGYHPSVDADGQRSGLNLAFNGTWIGDTFVEAPLGQNNAFWVEDLDDCDTFCAEMFGDLTGRFPYEVEENIPAGYDYAPFPDGVS